ncbi:MAG TPA: hypothetical protein VKY40_03290 [Halanaerobiales bacterium]|nr:hypothetical protein [Halanaerobiales bacterium]
MINLDYFCIKYGQKIGLTKENKEADIRKAFGILQEDGVYAMFLWLEDKDSTIREKGLIPLYNENSIKGYLLSHTDHFPETFNEFSRKLQEIAVNYNKLMFMKEITMRTLTYALYHAKVSAGEKNVEKS